MLIVTKIEGHGVKNEQDHGGGIVKAACVCERFEVQGDVESVARSFDRHIANVGYQAGLEELVA